MCKSYNTSMLQFADMIIDTFGSLASYEVVQIEESPPPSRPIVSCNLNDTRVSDLNPIPMEEPNAAGVDTDLMPFNTFSICSSSFLLNNNKKNKNIQYASCFTDHKSSHTMPKSRPKSARKAMKNSKRYSKIKDPNSIALQCRDNDILLGRGGHAINHAGNVKLLHAVKMNRALYKSVGRTEIGIARKRAIIEQIVSQVRSNGSRFLYREKKGGEWREASSRAVYEKISHMLRD